MTLGISSESALAAYNKRKAQLDRWGQSDTERESTEIKNRPKRVKFNDKCIFQAACASNDKLQVARMIRDGYNINDVDDDGITALHQACIEDNFEMVGFLLAHGADVNISDNEGWTPLHAVATCSFTSIAKLLLEHNANAVALNNDCNVPLDICKRDDIRELFKEAIAAKGIDLGEARRGEEIKMMEDAKEWLVNGYYEEEPHPTTGATAMHVAACKGYIKVLDQLIRAGADINAMDFDGWTPLHAAAHWGQEEACRVLLEASCDITLKNNCDQTAFDVADLSVAPVLDDYRKKSELKKADGKLNVLPLPPKKKTPRPVSNEDVGGQLGPKKKEEMTNSSSDDGEELCGSEAEDTVGDLPSLMEPLEPNHGSTQSNLISSLTTSSSMDPSSILPNNNNRTTTKKLCDNTQDENLPTSHETKPPPSDTKEGPAFLRPRDPLTQPKHTSKDDHAFLRPREPISNAFSPSVGLGEASRTRKLGDAEKVSSSLPSLTSPSGSSLGSTGNVAKSDHLKAESGGSGDNDESGAAWRRGGSLRTRTRTPTVPEEESTNNDKAAVRRARNETTPEVSLRRAYSFESDSNFYSRLTTARNRIKAIEEAQAAMNLDNNMSTFTYNPRVPSTSPATSLGTTSTLCSTNTNTSSTTSETTSNTIPTKSTFLERSRFNSDPTTEDSRGRLLNKTHVEASSGEPGYNLGVVLRRKEKEAEPSRSPRPTTISSTSAQSRSPRGNNTSVQMRSGDGENSTPTTPSPTSGGAKPGPVSKFKQFLIKSFVPPARDEESETQRKAHAKRVRETRRSTQGVTLEELKSAEQYVKAQQGNALTTNEQTPETTPMNAVPGTTTVTTTGALRKDEDSLERRPSWRLRVDDSGSKFSLEDLRSTPTRLGGSDIKPDGGERVDLMSQRSPRVRRNELIQNRPPRPADEVEQSVVPLVTEDKEVKSTGAQAVIAKKKRPKRRSTGVVSYSTDGSEWHDGAQSDSEASGRGSDLEGAESPKSENGVVTKVNYRKLYEETLKENQQLKTRISGLEDQLEELRLKMERNAISPRIGSDSLDKREKRALEQKFREMEEELKLLQKLKLEGEKLKAENRALTRVVSKLSGSANSNSNTKGVNNTTIPQQQK